MEKYMILICAVIFLLSNVSADLILNPNPLIVSAESGSQTSQQIEMKNTHNFTIFDFKFTNLPEFTFPNITLEPNETEIINIEIDANSPRVENVQSEVSFKYLIELPEETMTHDVNITNEGFKPNFIAIREGDTIRWTNLDTISRTVTTSTIDEDIQPNQSFSYTFNDVGTISYQDLILFYGGTIEVLNRTEGQRVNNPLFNKILFVELEFFLDPTLLEITLDKLNFTVEATSNKESVLRVKNTGNILAQKVVLSSEPNWIKFDENNFNLEPNQENIVTYSIEPLIYNTSETDKDYTISINAKASNTININKSIDVFIPFTEVLDDIESNEGFLVFFMRYCEQNPNLIICNNTLGGGENQTIISDPTIPVNLSTRELLNTLRRIGDIQDQVERTTNDQKQLNDLLETSFPEFQRLINESVKMQLENEQNSTARTRAFWIVILFSVVIGCSLVIGYYVQRYSSKKSIVNQGYTVRY